MKLPTVFGYVVLIFVTLRAGMTESVDDFSGVGAIGAQLQNRYRSSITKVAYELSHGKSDALENATRHERTAVMTRGDSFLIVLGQRTITSVRIQG